MPAKNLPGVLDKKGERHLRIILPVCGKKVVVEKIDQHSPVMSEPFVESPLAAEKVLVSARKGIDRPVQQNPLFDSGRIMPFEPPLDEITHEIANKKFRDVTREKEVGKKVHGLASCPFPLRSANGKKSMAQNNIFRLTHQDAMNRVKLRSEW